MTKYEACEIEKQCDELMSICCGQDCTVSLALTGKLKVIFDDGDYITITKDGKEVDYVSFTGWYSELVDKVTIVLACINTNKESFDKLIWSYEHMRELE